jgi:phytoene desaturase
MSEKWDTVVIGAGMGGLSTAGRLAKAGRKVLVLEQHSGPGGYATGMRRGAYYFDFSLHSMDGVSPGGWAYGPLHQVGILDRVPFERLDPYYLARLPGREIVVDANPFLYEEALIRQFPAEASGMRAMFDEMLAVYRDAHRLHVDYTLERYPSPEAMLHNYGAIIRASSETWQQFMKRYLSNAELMAVISALWTYCGLPPSRLNAATYILLWGSAHYHGAFYPQGGSQAINQAFEAIIRENGGDLLYGQRVTKLQVDKGLVVAAVTDQGLEVEASTFVSNANAPDTLLRLIDPEQLPAGYRNRVEVTPSSLSSFNIYLGLNRDLVAEGWPAHSVVVAENYDLEKQYQATLSGQWEEVTLLLAHYTAANPVCAPAGHSVLTIMCLAPWNYRGVWGTEGEANQYQAVKEEVAGILLRRAEKQLPGLCESIVTKEVATPLTNARFTLNRNGSLYGYEQSVEGMYLNRLNEETPIPNLYLAGAWTQPGGGQSAALISGFDAAGHCLKYLECQESGSLYVSELSPGAKKVNATPAIEPVSPATTFQPAGGPAPALNLTAVGSGRAVNGQTFAGRPLALIFASQSTTAAIGEINAAIRSQFPLASQVAVASVVPLGNVPRLFHKLIGLALKRVYRQAAADVPSQFDAADYVLILPDWHGEACRAFNVQGTEKAAAVVVIDRSGYIQGSFQGDDLADTTVEALRWL